MNETLIALLVTLAVVVGGNLLVVALRARHPLLADRLVRYLPAMAAAASSKDREAAIRRLVEAVAAEELGAAKIAARELARESKPPSASKLPPMPVLALLVASLAFVGCTPQQKAQAKAFGVPVAQVVGGVCEQISGVTRDDIGGAFVDFACTVVRAAGSVIGNLDSSSRVAVDMPDGPPVKVTVRVYLEGGRTEVLP